MKFIGNLLISENSDENYMAIKYSDGKQVEKDLYQFLKTEKDLGSHIDLWPSRYYSFAYRYHLSSLRSNLLRHFNFEGLRVLELGAGMGGVSRFLAESCQFLHVVEGAEQRYAALKERLKDLSNWTGTVANIEDFSTPEKFDVVCLVGVLEYSEKYIQSRGQMSPFDVEMQIAKMHLKPGGALIVAIENKLGLKYWNGAEEDHTGRMFDSITGYRSGPGVKTFIRQELLDLFSHNGFGDIEEFYPFPDYKLPTAIFHSSAFNLPAEVLAEIACKNEFESYGNTRQPFYPDYLAQLEVARAGLMQNMANSFLYVGFIKGQNDIEAALLQKLLKQHEKTWFYSKRAKGQILSTFTQDNSHWNVVKKIAIPWTSEPVTQWHPVNEKLVYGTSVRETLERAAYHHQWQTITDELATFLKWLLQGQRYQENEIFLADAVWANSRQTEHEYQLFDQEWHIPLNDNKYTDIEGWIVFRNILALALINHYWSKSRPWRTLKQLYEQISKQLEIPTNYDLHLQNEARFHAEISGNTNVDKTQKNINKIMTKRRWRQPYITNPQDWTTLTRYCSIYISKLRFLQRIELRIRKWKNR